MDDYFRLVSNELLLKLNQIKTFVKKHNQTIGVLTEEVLRLFLKTYLPKGLSVEQGFIMSENGELSKQCDILIYDSIRFAPFYRVNDVVIVPVEAVVIVIEVKTTINKAIFNNAIRYFKNIKSLSNCKFYTYLFIYNSCEISKLKVFFDTYHHEGEYQLFDHDTFESLPDEITGINHSFHLQKDSVVIDRDMMGYSSFFYENEKGADISALEIFYLSVHRKVNQYLISVDNNYNNQNNIEAYFGTRVLSNYFAIELFDM